MLTDAQKARNAKWSLQRWNEPLKYRPENPTLEDTTKARDELQAQEASTRAAGDEAKAADLRALVERKNRAIHRIKQLPPGENYPLAVALWRIGGATWIGVQGESYSLLQTELRKRFPDQILVIASIASNWGASYLPPKDIYGTGMYQDTIAVVAAGGLEQLIEGIAKRLGNMND